MTRGGPSPDGRPDGTVDPRGILWELAVDAGGIGTFDWDLVTRRLVWDARLIALFGYDEATFDESIEAFEARLHPDDVDRVRQDLGRAIDRVGVFDSEYRLVLPSGELRWVGAHGRAVAGPDGTAVRLLGAAYDVTDRRGADATVGALIESMATAFFALDTDWRFTYVNTEATKLLGRSREEMVGGNVWELFPDAVGSDFERHYRRAMTTGESVTFQAYYPAPLDSWYEVRAWRTPDGLAVYFLDVTARHALALNAQRAAERAELLSRITEELVSTLDHATAGRRLADLVVPALADWCVVSLVDDDQALTDRRRLSNIAARHHDPARQAQVEEYGRLRWDQMSDHAILDDALAAPAVQHVPRDALAQLLPMFGPGRARDLLTELEPGSALVLPLDGPNGPVGLLSLVNGAQRGDFTDEDLVTARHVAARAGLVLDNARLYRRQRDVAEALQRSLLSAPAQPEHAEVVVRYLPASEAAAVGGDWYDAFLQPSGTVIAVGDVTGHNIEAAAVMAQLRSLLRGIAVHSGETPAEVLRGVDEAVHTLRIDTTASAVVARLEPVGDGPDTTSTRLRWSNAGHPPPVVLRPDGRAEVLDGPRPELLLGVLPGVRRTDHEVVLPRGATVLFYTDGLVERRDEGIEEGIERLRSLLAEAGGDGLPLEDLCDRLVAGALPHGPADDVALVAVRLDARPAATAARAGAPPSTSNAPEARADGRDGAGLALEHSEHASARARHYVADRIGHLPRTVVDDALVMTSELVSNAVRHTSGVITVEVHADSSSATVTVADHGVARLDAPTRLPGPDQAHGRGLLIVTALATDWGVVAGAGERGKAVWFRVGG